MALTEDAPPAESLTQVFLRFRARLARAVARIVRPSDIEDIVQETFLRCYQAAEKTTIRYPRSFMLTTAKNLALNHVARADNHLVCGVASFEDSAVPLYRDGESRQNDPELQEEFLLLCQAVRTLPVQCRRAFILKKAYGLSRKEIASYMGIAESTVQKHIAKGVLLCADYLQHAEPATRHEQPDHAAQPSLKRESRR
jgi:RNA polymerase sigma factor (sigma-70 family)